MRTFYVDNTAPVGGDGSELYPFDDLPRWEAIQADGDIVHVKNTGTRYQGVRVKVAPVQLLGEIKGESYVGLNPDDLGYNCIRVDLSERWDRKQVGGIIIEGFDAFGGTQSGFWGSIADGITIRRCRAFDSGIWGFHFTGCDNLIIEDNEAIRPKQQHGIYVTGCSQNPQIRRNKVYYPHNIGIHINNDKDDSEKMFKDHPEYLTKTMKECIVEANFILDAAYGGGGGGIDGDGVEDSEYRNNVIISEGWGINIHAEDSKETPDNIGITSNTVVARWPININDGSTNVSIGNNYLCSTTPGANYIDTNGVEAPGLVDSGNTKTNTSPFTPAQLAEFRSRYQSPENAEPTEPIEQLPQFPASEDIEDADPTTDLSRYDLESIGLLCREYDTQTHFGTPKVESYQLVPDRYWGSANVPTPHGFVLPNLGINFVGAYNPNKTEEIGIYMEGQGDVTGSFAGETIISGSADVPALKGEIFVRVQSGSHYAISAGTNSNASGRSPSLRIRIRRRGDTVRKTLDSLACVPLKLSGIIAPPVDPPGPNPQTPDSIFDHPQWPKILELLRAANGK